MLYIAKSSDYKMFESTDNDMNSKAEPIIHTWTVGKQYEISIDKDTITLQSNTGTTKTLSPLNIDKELMMNVFGIDITNMIQTALEHNKAQLVNEYKAKGDINVII